MIGQKRNDTNFRWANGGNGGAVEIGGGLDINKDTGKVEVNVDNSTITINEGNQITINEIPENVLPIASKTEKGIVQIGEGLDVSSEGVISTNYENLPIASAETLGGVRIGENLTISSEGILSATGGGGGGYVLPTATKTRLGGIKVGENLTITTDGTLSASGGGSYELPPATSETLGGVYVPSDSGLQVEEDGALSVVGGLDGAGLESNEFIKFSYNQGSNFWKVSDAPIKAEAVFENVYKDYIVYSEVKDFDYSENKFIDCEVWRANSKDFIMHDFSYNVSRDSSGNIIDDEGNIINNVDARYEIGENGLEFNGEIIAENISSYTTAGNVAAGEYVHYNFVTGNNNHINGQRCTAMSGNNNYIKNCTDTLILGENNHAAKVGDGFSEDAKRNIISGQCVLSIGGRDNILNGSGRTAINEQNNRYYNCIGTISTGSYNEIRATDSLVCGGGNVTGHFETAYGMESNPERAYTTDAVLDALNASVMAGVHNKIYNNENISGEEEGSTVSNSGIFGAGNTFQTSKQAVYNNVFTGEDNTIGEYDAGNVTFKNSLLIGQSNTAKGSNEDTSKDAIVSNSIFAGFNNYVEANGNSSERSLLDNSIMCGQGNTCKSESYEANIINSIVAGNNNKAENGTYTNSFITGYYNKVTTENNKIAEVKNSFVTGDYNEIKAENTETRAENCLIAGYNNIIKDCKLYNAVIAGQEIEINNNIDNVQNLVWASGKYEPNILLYNDGTIKAKNVIIDGVGVNQTVKVKSVLITTSQLTEADDTMPFATHKFDLPQDCINVLSIAKNANNNVNFSITDIDTENRICGFRMFDNSDIILSYSYK